MSAAILFGSMALMIGFGIPIAIVLGVSSALTLLFSGAPLGVIPSMMQATVQKFSLLTIPLFVLAGAIMDKGGISKRLINLADSIIGPVYAKGFSNALFEGGYTAPYRSSRGSGLGGNTGVAAAGVSRRG